MTTKIIDGLDAQQVVSNIDDLIAAMGSPGAQAVANSAAVCDSGSGILGSTWGVAGVPFHSADASGTAASVSDAPTSGQKLVLDDIIFSVDTNMQVTFKCETTGAVVFGPFYCLANGGPMQITPRGKKKLATADKKLQVQTSASGNITVSASYHSEV